MSNVEDLVEDVKGCFSQLGLPLALDAREAGAFIKNGCTLDRLDDSVERLSSCQRFPSDQEPP